MSREERDIRPYRGLEAFETALDGLCVEFGDRQIFAGGLATTTSADFVRQPVTLVLGEDEAERDQVAAALQAACAQAELDTEALELLVVMRTTRLKISEIVWRASLDKLGTCPPRVALTRDKRPRPLETPIGGCSILTYIALREERNRVALAPWRKGTWVAKAEYKIKTNINEIGFTLLELTDEIRNKQDLPDGTLRFAIVETPLDESTGPESIQLYLDAEVLSELAANPKTAAAEAFSRELFLTATAAAVMESSRQLLTGNFTTVDDIEGSLAHRLIQLVVGDAPPRQLSDLHQRFFQMLRNDPARFAAHIENRVGNYRKDTIANLRGSGK